jgi:uroporphyrinogen-III decarboxylase
MRNTMPERYKGLSLAQILDDMRVDHYWMDGHFSAPSDVTQSRDITSNDYAIGRGLGFYGLRRTGYRQELTNVDIEITRDGDNITVNYHTPVGSVSSKMALSEELYKRGITVVYPSEMILREEKDYQVVGHIFRNIKVYPDYQSFEELQATLGEKGLAFAAGHVPASPMHHIMHDLMDISRFYLELYDHPNQLRQLVEDMTPYYDSVMRILADSSAEAVWYGVNFDEMITYRPFFREHILPWIQKYAEWMHANGKVLACHCDGENEKLLDLYLESGMDIADAIGCAPMYKSTIRQLREAFKGKITIFGGLPSVMFLESNFSDDDFRRYIAQLFKDIAPGDRIILAVSDSTPPDAKFDRLVYVQEMVEENGNLPLS